MSLLLTLILSSVGLYSYIRRYHIFHNLAEYQYIIFDIIAYDQKGGHTV